MPDSDEKLVLDLSDCEIHIIYEALTNEKTRWEKIVSETDDEDISCEYSWDFPILDWLLRYIKEKKKAYKDKRITMTFSFTDSAVLIESLNNELKQSPNEVLKFISDYIKTVACEEFGYRVIIVAERTRGKNSSY